MKLLPLPEHEQILPPPRAGRSNDGAAMPMKVPDPQRLVGREGESHASNINYETRSFSKPTSSLMQAVRSATPPAAWKETTWPSWCPTTTTKKNSPSNPLAALSKSLNLVCGTLFQKKQHDGYSALVQKARKTSLLTLHCVPARSKDWSTMTLYRGTHWKKWFQKRWKILGQHLQRNALLCQLYGKTHGPSPPDPCPQNTNGWPTGPVQFSHCPHHQKSLLPPPSPIQPFRRAGPHETIRPEKCRYSSPPIQLAIFHHDESSNTSSANKQWRMDNLSCANCTAADHVITICKVGSRRACDIISGTTTNLGSNNPVNCPPTRWTISASISSSFVYYHCLNWLHRYIHLALS